jgi:hypothetical protein
MGKTRETKGPSAWAIKRHAKEIDAFGDFVKLREKLKLEGMTPSEACQRAGMELRIEERWADWWRRKNQGIVLGKDVPLTPGEMKQVIPAYVAPSLTQSAEVGTATMSLAEQVQWAKRALARVRNGEPAPTSFPNDDTMYWYQNGVSNQGDFEKIVVRVEAPEKEGADAWMRDGQYQFGEIEKQIVEAVKEAGDQLVQQERGFAEALHGLLSVGAEGSGVESLVPA